MPQRAFSFISAALLLLVAVPLNAADLGRLSETPHPEAGAPRLAGSDAPLMKVQFVDTSHDHNLGHSRNQPGMGSGCAAADYDNDGWVDLYCVQAEGFSGLLLHNDGTGHFEYVTNSGIHPPEGGRTALWFDADNDGLLDLMIANDVQTSPTSFRFYHQNPDHTFTETTEQVGLFKTPIIEISVHHWGGLCAGDINNDGWLDVFTGQWSGPAHLFLNRGDGTFKDISDVAGFPTVSSWRHQPIMADFNGDGWMDIYTAVDFDANEMWINQHDNTFVDVAPAAGLDNLMNDMGVTLGDYDNDGDLDIYLTNIHTEGKHNVLYRNDSVGGDLHFTEISGPMGVDNGYWGWGTTWLDVDNDGMLDLAATDGWTTTQWVQDPSRFFYNGGGSGAFADVSDQIGFDDTDWGSSLVAADFDHDGDLDMVQVCMSSPYTVGRDRFLENVPVPGLGAGHYLMIRPRASDLNRFAIGAVVHVQANGKNMMRLITAGTSYLGQEPAEAFFGLGGATTADRVEIDWPDGVKTVRENVAADQILQIMHPKRPMHANIDIKPGNDQNVVNLKEHGVLPVAIFSDDGFDATQVDPLSIRLSGAPVRTLGNGQAMVHVEDVNKDHRPDLMAFIEVDQIQMPPGQSMGELTAMMPVDQPIVGSDKLGIAGQSERPDRYAGPQGADGTALEFALHGPSPNPAGRDLSISFSLPNADRATLELYDVAGRRLASVDVGALGAGRHLVRVGESVHVTPGLYFVRLAQGRNADVTRVVVSD